MEQQQTFTQRDQYPAELRDSFALGRALSLIEALLRSPNDDFTQTAARGFLAEMDS